jgi:hypothetical protein
VTDELAAAAVASHARRLAALALGAVGTLAAGGGAGLVALARERHGTGGEVALGGVIAGAGLVLVLAAVRLARLQARRAAIATLASLLLVPPIAVTVRDNLAGSTSHAPVKRTMSDLRSLGFALESRAVDFGGYPPTGGIDELAPVLAGAYMRSVPRVDGWGRPLRYEAIGSGAGQRYFVGSAGADGRWERTRLVDYATSPARSGDDIVYSNQGFVAAPQPPSE